MFSTRLWRQIAQVCVLTLLAGVGSVAPPVTAKAPPPKPETAPDTKPVPKRKPKPAPVASSISTLPPMFVGVASDDTFAGSSAYRQVALSAQRRNGIGLLRQLFDWQFVEPYADRFDFAQADAFVLDAARAGITVMPVLFGEPQWASARPPGDTLHGAYPPRDPAQFAAYAAAVAQRYGPGGTLWTEHPEIPPLPTTAYQVWNEPNLYLYWLPTPSAPRYAHLLHVAAAAIRAVQPGAQVLTAGMPDSKLGIPLLKYIDQLYKAGAAPDFDTVSVNAYSLTADDFMARLDDVRKVMASNHDRAAGLWVTEFGWGDSGPRASFNVGPARQAKLVSDVVMRMGRARHTLRLGGFVYYNWTDLPPYPGRTDFWGLHTGLYRADGHPKPAAVALQRAVNALTHP